MTRQHTILQKYIIPFILLSPAIIFLFITACKPFDKEIKQDQHIAAFRLQLSRVQDSIDDISGRVVAYQTIIDQIAKDKGLIAERKKNNLLIEGNVYLCNEYLISGGYDKAIDVSNEILRIDSTQAKGYYKRGSIYQLMNNDSLALLDYAKTLELNPDYTDAFYNRGIIYQDAGSYELALKDYTRAIKKEPLYIGDAYNNRGNVYLATNEVEKALADYDKALEYDSTNAKIYCNRAWAHYMSDDFDKALSDCNKALALDSLNINAITKRASIYEKKEQYAEAIKDYKNVIKLDSLDAYNTHAESKKSITRLKGLKSKG